MHTNDDYHNERKFSITLPLQRRGGQGGHSVRGPDVLAAQQAPGLALLASEMNLQVSVRVSTKSCVCVAHRLYMAARGTVEQRLQGERKRR